MNRTKYTFTLTVDTRFSVTANSVTYNIRMLWLDMSECWTIDIYKHGEPIVMGRVVNSDNNLLPTLEKNGRLYFSDDAINKTNIGRTCFLYHEAESE